MQPFHVFLNFTKLFLYVYDDDYMTVMIVIFSMMKSQVSQKSHSLPHRRFVTLSIVLIAITCCLTFLFDNFTVKVV